MNSFSKIENLKMCAEAKYENYFPRYTFGGIVGGAKTPTMQATAREEQNTQT